MAATLWDVAQHCGVSRSTASRALSGSDRISEETRAAVLRAAGELGYRPNRTARALRTQSSRLIGLVMTNLVNASFHTMTEVIQHRLSDEDYQVVLCLTGSSTEQEAKYVSMLVDHRVDGLIMMGSDGVVGIPQPTLESGVPVVNLIRREEPAALDAVFAADTEGAYEATRHLLSLGHRRVGLVVGLPDNPSGNDRRGGYLRALSEAGIDASPELIVSGPYHPDFGAEAVRSLLDLDDRPTAIFLANHEAAFGALPQLTERDIAIPSELSVICFEDAPSFQYWRPALTVVDHDPRGLAELAVDILLKKLRNSTDAEASSGKQYRLGARLIHRGSCAAPGQRSAL